MAAAGTAGGCHEREKYMAQVVLISLSPPDLKCESNLPLQHDLALTHLNLLLGFYSFVEGKATE